MSKTWEHYHHAARHHEKAAYHYKEAVKYDQAEEHEKAAHPHTSLTGTVNMRFTMTSRQRNCMPSSVTWQRLLQSKEPRRGQPLNGG